MKQRILPTLIFCSVAGLLHAQDGKKAQAYAITGAQKGGGAWTEVRLVDVTTGEEIKSIYKSGGQSQVFNARTGKPIAKKEVVDQVATGTRAASPQRTTYTLSAPIPAAPGSVAGAAPSKPVVRIDNIDAPSPVVIRDVRVTTSTNVNVMPAPAVKPNVNVTVEDGQTVIRDGNRVIVMRNTARERFDESQPFATSSAACAYDARHERLYYTPMGINQLRYIDLKSGKIYFFEGESFGPLKGRHDVANQITRMAIGSDGNGYALTNDGRHLIRFSLEKKAAKTSVEDLGSLSDDAVNGSYSVHSGSGFGGDMIADANKNLYLITANRNVFRIGLENRVATFLGAIRNLPRGFTTNGAVVEEGSKVIVSSSNSTQGYFRFDLNTLEAEKLGGASVFNASDLANDVLAFEKKKKDRRSAEAPPAAPQDVVDTKAKPTNAGLAETGAGSIITYPNPVSAGLVKMNFSNQPKGRYSVQLLDLGGKLITSKEVSIGGKLQTEEFRLPDNIAKGSYLVRIVNARNEVATTSKIIVE